MKVKRLIAGALAASMLSAGCGNDRENHFENREGDIIADELATVLGRYYNPRSTGKNGPYGYVLYLVTEDCKDDVPFEDGPGIAEGCDDKKHKVSMDTFLQYSDGDTISWDDRESPSEVIEHRYGQAFRREKVYDLGLLVEQCLLTPGTELGITCVQDFVEVRFNTWYGAREGDAIRFAGDEGEVVSG